MNAPLPPVPPQPPSDVERTQVLARLIRSRIRELHTLARAGRSTAADRRELVVLEELVQTWLLEGAD